MGSLTLRLTSSPSRALPAKQMRSGDATGVNRVGSRSADHADGTQTKASGWRWRGAGRTFQTRGSRLRQCLGGGAPKPRCLATLQKRQLAPHRVTEVEHCRAE
jgi:hypothetical protein